MLFLVLVLCGAVAVAGALSPSSLSTPKDCEGSFASTVTSLLESGKECKARVDTKLSSVVLGDAILGENGYYWYTSKEEVVSGIRNRELFKVTGRCFISDNLQFAFRHVLKSGGSSVGLLIRLAVGNAVSSHKPGDPYPKILQKIPFGLDPKDLRLGGCNSVPASYFQFSFVRDPFDRVKSIYYFAKKKTEIESPNRQKKPLPSLEQFFHADMPKKCLAGSTPLALQHADPQARTLLNLNDPTDDSLAVDFLCNLKKINHCHINHIIPTIRSKAMKLYTGDQLDKMLKKLDLWVKYLLNPPPRQNITKKKDFTEEEESRYRCLVKRGPYAVDYSAFFTTQQQQ
eukprot:m.243217 g.243217  ORF g.243217 m.243217 type:complete len:343 (+) comp41347_c0_seq1:35-1063(+)